jgi:hypothetical protein
VSTPSHDAEPAHDTAPASHSAPSAPAPAATRKTDSAPLPAPAPVAPVARHAPSVADYGVTGRGAHLTLRNDGVDGKPAIRVALARRGSQFEFQSVGDVEVARVGLAYRIGAWLRSDAPGVTVCLRIEEVSPKDPLAAVRTTETCLSPTAEWRHFRILRRTLARGDKLVFSVYSYGAELGDSFEIDHFLVLRKTTHGWKRVDSAFAPQGANRR